MASNCYITNRSLLYSENVADVLTLEEVVSDHKEKFGNYFKAAAADRAYYGGQLIVSLEKEHDIILVIAHKKRKNALLDERKKDYMISGRLLRQKILRPRGCMD